MKDENDPKRGEIPEGDFHPAAPSALAYVNSLSYEQQCIWLESFASTSIAGNKASEILGETLRRIMDGEKVSDRYVLGLAWFLKQNEEEV